MKYKYVGKDFIVGLPARDLTADDVALYGEDFIKKTELYKAIEDEKIETKPIEKEGL